MMIILVLTFLMRSSPALAESPMYVVQNGDSLFRIALRYSVTVESIRIANGLSDYSIYAGQVLVIPNGQATRQQDKQFGLHANTAPSSETGSKAHIVMPGETLYAISLRYGVSIQAILASNHLSGTSIYYGQRLVIPSRSPIPSSDVPLPAISPTTTPLRATPVAPTSISSSLRPSVRIWNINGEPQSLHLDCESRSAVDWAAYFGVHLDELAFFRSLPVSDNPEKGFVGNVNGSWGQIPPNPYGVHPEPVAAQLRAYGVPAKARRGMSWDSVRAQIAAGQPVIVWVTGHVNDGRAVWYTVSDGTKVLVAPYEHTVLVIGYTPAVVTVLDGGSVYGRSISQFLRSWGVLGSLAITRQ